MRHASVCSWNHAIRHDVASSALICQQTVEGSRDGLHRRRIDRVAVWVGAYLLDPYATEDVSAMGLQEGQEIRKEPRCMPSLVAVTPRTQRLSYVGTLDL